MNTAPTTAPSLPIVGYGVENTRPTERQPMMLLMLDLTGVQYPELHTRLVRESDALAAIDVVRKDLALTLKGYNRGIRLIADMHEAAMGDTDRPVEGYVADIKALRVERDSLRDAAAESAVQVAALTAERDALRTAASAVVELWDSPTWKEAEHTATFINRLRVALTAVERAPVGDEELAPVDYEAAHAEQQRMVWRMESSNAELRQTIARLEAAPRPITKRERTAGEIEHSIMLKVEEQTADVRAENARLRGVVAVQHRGLLAVAELIERTCGIVCGAVQWWHMLRETDHRFARLMGPIDAAIAITGGEAQPVAGEVP